MRRLALALSVLAAFGCQRRQDAQAAREQAQYDRYRQPEKIVAGLALQPGMRVADVGAGHGYLTGRIADAVAPSGHVVATDIDGSALATIELSPLVETRVVKPDDPGLEPGAYDRILVAEVDHYLADRTAYFAKLRRALKPGGYIVVTNRLGFRPFVVAAGISVGLRAVELPLSLPQHFYLRLEPS
jgi:predicted methyltransferase